MSVEIITKQISKGNYQNNEVENRILDMYKEIGLGRCEICRECRKTSYYPEDLSIPIGAWCVGSAFYEQEQRILFVGKTARSNPGKDCGTFRDAFAVTREFLWWEYWDNNGKGESMPSAYWGYTAALTERIFGTDSPEFIAFTNILKCNDSPDVDTASIGMKESCIRKLRVLTREIEIIKPTHIIFYTGRAYDDFVPYVFDRYGILTDGEKQIGAHQMPWQEARGSIAETEYKVLRIGHPERKEKEDFIQSIAEWLEKN